MSNYYCTNSGVENENQQESCGCEQSGGGAPIHGCCCPCAEDFRKALGLLCSPRLQPLVDFAAFSFITDNYVLGTAIADTSAVPVSAAPSDNLTDPAARFTCGGDSCESLTVSGTLYPAVAASAPLTTSVTQAALCQLDAITFDASDIDEGAAANFQTLSQRLGQCLRPQKPQECTSVAEALTSAAAVRASTITAGPLVVENSTIIGQLGNVLVMANAASNRFYLICANKVGVIG